MRADGPLQKHVYPLGIIKDPILDKDTGLVLVMHARGTSGSTKRICCIGK